MQEFLEPFERLLASHAESDGLWEAISESGFLDVLVAESMGGAGLSLAAAEPLIRALGRYAIDAPVAETIACRALGVVTLDRPVLAILAATRIAGLAERALEMSLAYANDRVQFGKPIGKLQVIQQQLAVLGEQVLMVRMASQMGCAAGLQPDERIAAIAKQVASAAVPTIASIAHAVHGAIGITEEYDLQRYTRGMHALRLAHGSESYWARVLGAARIADAAAQTSDFIRALRQP